VDQRHPRSHEPCYCNRVRRPLAADPTSSTLCRARQNHLEVEQQWDIHGQLCVQGHVPQIDHHPHLAPHLAFPGPNSAYKAMFLRSTTTLIWRLTWRSQAPIGAKFFLWLASMDWCWTAERRACHGLPHAPLCKFCSQEPKSLDPLLVQCDFSMLVQCAFSKITWHEILSSPGVTYQSLHRARQMASSTGGP
jgi:hypothetical protein